MRQKLSAPCLNANCLCLQLRKSRCLFQLTVPIGAGVSTIRIMRAHFFNFKQRISLPVNWRGAAFCMIAEKTIKRAFASFIALWAAEATLLETRAQPMLPLTNTVFMAEVNLASEKGSIWENGVG